MKKIIKADGVQSLSEDWIPYKNKWGHWVWTPPHLEPDMNWPGSKAPPWVKSVIYDNGKWMWSD